MFTLTTVFASHLSVGNLAIRSTIVLVAAAIFTLLLRQRSAALRHRIWLLALAASVVIPILSIACPTISVPIVFVDRLMTVEKGPGTTDEATTTSPDPTILPLQQPVVANQAVKHESAGKIVRKNEKTNLELASQSPTSLNVEQLLLRCWLVGLGIGVGVFALGFVWQTSRGNQLPILNDSDWQQSVQQAAKRIGLKRTVTTVVSDVMHVPVVFGVFRTKIVVPTNWRVWSDNQRECILLHELAHVQRGDVATQVFARLAVLVQWFNPLAWHAARQLRVERELASDDCVLRTGCSASDYAQQLLLTVKQYCPVSIGLGVAMAHSARLDDRVRAILDVRKDRAAVGWRSFFVASTLTLICCVALGAMTLANGPVPIAALQSDPQAPVWKAGHTYYYSRTLPTSLAFAADGNSLLSADASGQLMSLNLQAESNTYIWSAKVTSSHPAVAYSLDGKTIFATCDDGVVLFDAKGNEVWRIEEKNSKPIAIDVFPINSVNDNLSLAKIAFGNARGYFVKTWATGNTPGAAGTIQMSILPDGTEPADPLAVPLAVDPRGRSAIMTGPIDGTGDVTGRAGANVLWAYVCGNYEAGSPGNRVLKGHDTHVVSAAWSKEGSTAITGDADGRVIEWNPTRLNEKLQVGDMKEVRRHEFGGRVASLAVSNNGKRIAAYVLGKQGRIYVWNAGEPTDKLAPIYVEPTDLSGKNAFASVAISADGKRLAACAGDRKWLEQTEDLRGKVRLWNFDSAPSQQPAPKLAFENPHRNVWGEDLFIPNNNAIYVTSKRKEGAIDLYDIDDGRILSAMGFGDDVSLQRMVRSANRDWMVIGQSQQSSDSKLFRAEVRHANFHPPRKTIPDCQQILGLAGDGKELAVVRAGKIEVWNTVTGELIEQAPFEPKQFDAAAFSGDANLLVLSAENSLILWDRQNNKHDRIDVGRTITALAFSPDGRFLAEGPKNADDIQLRDLKTQQIVRTFKTDQPLNVPHIAFTQSGRILIACDKFVPTKSVNEISRPRIFMWDTADSSLAHKITVPGLPQSFDVSPNELYLVARVTGPGGDKLMGWRLDGKNVVGKKHNAAPAAEAN